jgi:hypothetical protein
MEGLSADLSKASDYIQFPVAYAVYSGFKRAMRDHFCSEEFHDMMLLAIGPMTLAEPSASERKLWEEAGLMEYVGRSTTRGALMGLSLTWPILTVLNVYAASYKPTDDLGRPPSVRSRPAFVVCGDDLGAIWEKLRTELYFQKISDVGLVINVSKSYRSEALRLIFV